VNQVYNNTVVVAGFPLDYGHYVYPHQETSAGYNPEQAKKVLEEAGWKYQYNTWRKKEGYITLKLNMTITVDETHTGRMQTAEIIQNQLEAIGMKVTIQKVSHEKYMQILQERNYQMILTGIQNGISPDVSYFFGEGNVASYQNDTALQLVQDAQKTIKDPKALQEIYKKLIDVYNKEMPFLGLYRNKQTLVTSQSVSGEMTPTFYTSYYHFETWKNS
jgi:peptide/nickel transport system substrate-binding protein